MKKATLSYLLNVLNDQIAINGGEAYSDEQCVAARDEIVTELNKGQARKDAKDQEYYAIHDLVMENLSDTPVTIAELWESIKNDVPEGVTKGKIQYAMLHLWVGQIVKIDGKPCTYRRA